MTRVFVYEYLCGGGMRPAGERPWAASLVTEGRAMLHAAAADFARVPGVRVAAVLDERLRGDLRFPGEVTWVKPGEDEAAFRSAARSADWSLVIAPEFNHILEARCRWVVDEGGRLLGPTPAAVALTADKLALADHLTSAGVPTPQTLAVREVSPSDMPSFLAFNYELARIPLPWIVKPRFGAGSQETRFIDCSVAFTLSPGVQGQMIVQPFLPGVAASVAFLIGPNQTIALEPALQSFADNHRFEYKGGSIPLGPALRERAQRIARRAVAAVPCLFGFIGVDLILGDAADGTGDSVIEINPRLTTSYVGLRKLAQDNLMGVLLSVAGGERVAELRWRPGSVTFSADGTTETNA